ncbi:flagellar hook protein FlgE [Nitrosomonas sp. PY1]|uniref:flagellar hook protein FlgE n=1 Tax=Nitrosomonas sp. PY1 TaxID=1803906 RepID=UPI001FC8B936|nr:flagellar hook protein FlgE [Nitrosomonas sp. PY1]GKS68507.1 flagellar hook protein FlgE [Nitrosomonas sp. PY1]
MSFEHGLSGLNISSTNLDVIGNNIANANTVGFKESQAQFTDIYANSLAGSGTSQIGIGSRVATIAQGFNQGGITPTSNPLDIAINGQGFFRTNDRGIISYSRNGQFHVDANSFLTNASGSNVTGYMADDNGNIIASQLTNLKLNAADVPPKATANYDIGFNLNSNSVPPVVTTFNANDPKSYTNTTSGEFFDSLGNSHVLSFYFQKTATAGAWNIFATVDGKVDNTGTPQGVTLASTTLNFDTTGALTAPGPTAPFDVTVDLNTISPSQGATSPLTFSLDLTNSTQFGSPFGVNTHAQDGYTSGRLAGFKTSPDGIIQGAFTNGKTKTLGQIVLANFANAQGLTPVGNGNWIETPQSGQPIIGVPQTGTLGVLAGSSVEDANIDLTSELVKMITAQRMYQANAKTIETQDAILQTLVNL